MKRIISTMLLLIMIITLSGLNATAYAASDYTSASSLATNSSWSGEKWLTEGDTEQWYKISIPGDGKFTFKAMAYMSRLGVWLYNYDLSKEIYGSSWFCDGGKETQPDTSTFSKVLDAGTYYIKLSGYTGRYKIATEYVNYDVTDGAALSYDSPQTITAGVTVTCASTALKSDDWFKININSSGPYTFQVKSYTGRTGVWLYNYDLSNEIYGSYWLCDGGNEAQPKTNTFNKTLGPGTYYIKLSGYEGRYYFTWNALTPETCSHDYESSTVYATYFAKGYTLHTCRNCGATYKDNYTAKLKVSNASISSVKKQKKKLTLSLSANYYDVNGIQIQYSTNKKFTSAKTVSTKGYSKVLKGLKSKKKYYIRVRAYKLVDGKKAYSSWSKAKAVKTK